MKFQNYHFTIKTITPVCIGTGNKLSPYADYVIDEQRKKIYYVDQKLIKDKLATNLKLIDEYVAGVANGMDNNRSSFNLRQFLNHKLQIDITKQYKSSFDCCASGAKELYTIVKNAGLRPYIPGSSLKGAVKTALLYDWLIHTDKGRQSTVTLLKKPKDEYVAKDIEQQFNRYNPAFSDSDTVAENKIDCRETKRLHVKKGNDVIPQFWECIKPDVQLSSSFSVKDTDGTDYLEWTVIRNALNQYALTGNKCEWDMLTKDEEEKIPQEIFDSLYYFYEDINNDIQSAGPDIAYLKIGSGKGYYMNSIGQALFDADNTEGKSLFLKFLKANGFGKIFKREMHRTEEYDLHPYDFPVTRVLDIKNLLPLGWIKIELKK